MRVASINLRKGARYGVDHRNSGERIFRQTGLHAAGAENCPAESTQPPQGYNVCRLPTLPRPVAYPIVRGHGTDARGVKAMERDCGNALLQR